MDIQTLPPPTVHARATDPRVTADPFGTRPQPAPPLVVARGLTRWWGKGASAQLGIADVDLEIPRGELVAVVGPSGSGKSTLGALVAGIDTPTSGELSVDGVRVDGLRGDRLAAWRGANVGIVFQDFHLLPTLTAVENVELALRLGARHGRVRRRLRREDRRRVADALDRVGLSAHRHKLPAQMSGGEQQRVAVARALVTAPRLIVADEPTGALDQRNGEIVFGLLRAVVDAGTTVVMITHDPALAAAADRIVHMLDGRIDTVEVRVAVEGGGR